MDDSREEKYLMFFLNKEYYGIPIIMVNEVIEVMQTTPLHSAPKFIKGIINLRGKIIPVMDLRLKFNMSERAYDELTCTIIFSMNLNGQKKFIGMIVDKVAEVVNINKADIELPPQYGDEFDTSFLTGIAKIKDKVVMLLDMETIVHYEDAINLVKQSSKELNKM